MTTREAGPAAAAQTTTFPAMATRVTLRVADPGPAAGDALAAARAVFARVEAACTRFDPRSPLMRANADRTNWHAVPQECYLAVAEAARAHRETGGLFDPRVLDTLVALGYDRTLPFRSGVTLTGTGPARTVRTPPAASPWLPGLDPDSRSIRLGADRIDLGGIGKGLAVRLAARALAHAGGGHLIEAGGDCHVAGGGPDGDGWRIGVEDPAGGADPVAVLRLADTGCATSSLRVRSWRVDGTTVHHLIDPRTGRSAQGGLLSVTVLDPDPVRAEVWSKSLLIAGRGRIAGLAARRHLPALWVDDSRQVAVSAAMAPYVIWTAPDAT
ncbi:FAD:protein FMN transferase [Actinoplanes sp. NPDC049599]|uniref:FAD:protein FMN transferase n=1 Tax=Actinoplanes sp. NPDC049599 TaxID=3363903 RepID=UPI0037A73938